MDLAAINKMRELDGKEPLLELPSDPTNLNQSTSPEVAPASGAAKSEDAPNPVVVAEITDDALLEALQKKGIQITSFDELKPKEDPTQIAEQREAAILSYGLTKGKFNKKDYEGLIRDTSDQQNLVYQDFYAAAKLDDPDLTDEDIQGEFAEKFGLTAEAGTRKHKRGQAELAILADKLLKSKYQKIYAAETEYGQFESSQREQQEAANRIKALAPQYRKDIETAFSKLKKITAKFSDDEIYEVEAVDESLNSIKELMTNSDFASQQILKGTTVEELQEIAYTKFLRDNFPIIAKEIANQALLKHQKGTKGIIPIGPAARIDAPTLTPEQQKFVEMVNPQQAVAN
jgi:hypothetical protein